MMSAKLATLVLLKVNIFQNKGYGVKIGEYDVKLYCRCGHVTQVC